jgi:hypothetical protein
MQRLWSLRRAVGLSPTQQLFRELKRRGMPTREMDAVEVFAGTGFRHTIDYLGLVKHVEAWELEPSRESALRRNLPGATILITDSFEEVRRTPRRFGIVMVDNTLTTFGNGYVEHFDLFPELFRIVTDSSVLVLNVCPVVPDDERHDAPRMARRASFYGTDRPLEVPIPRMVEAYSALMTQSGLTLEWQFAIRRAYRRGIHYLALGMTRSPALANPS